MLGRHPLVARRQFGAVEDLETRPGTLDALPSGVMSTAGPILVDDPTKVMGRRIVAYFIDLAATFALAGAIGIGLFMAISVEGSYATPPAGVFTDSTSLTGCDEEQEVIERVPRPRRRGQSMGDRHVPVSAVPDYCVDFGGGSVRYIEDGAGFSKWVTASVIAGSALDLVVLQGLTGASVGKWLMGLRVIHRDGSRVRLGLAAWRWLLLAFDSMCCLAPGLVLAFAKPGHQRLGDLGAQSFVVKRSAAGEPLHLPGLE